MLFGIAPALQLTSRKVGGALRHGASGVVRGGAGPRLRKLLIAAQMAVSVVLLVSAGLLVRSFVHLQQFTFMSVVALLVTVAFGASWLPARRATRVDPIIALRTD